MAQLSHPILPPDIVAPHFSQDRPDPDPLDSLFGAGPILPPETLFGAMPGSLIDPQDPSAVGAIAGLGESSGATADSGGEAGENSDAPKNAEAEIPKEGVNYDDAATLMEKLGLDARRARLIVEFRTIFGPFRTPEDLSQVAGITEAMISAWENDGLLVFRD
jgi:hypothetical protein